MAEDSLSSKPGETDRWYRHNGVPRLGGGCGQPGARAEMAGPADDWRQQARLAVLLAASDVSRALDRLPVPEPRPASSACDDPAPEPTVPIQALREQSRQALWASVMQMLDGKVPAEPPAEVTAMPPPRARRIDADPPLASPLAKPPSSFDTREHPTPRRLFEEEPDGYPDADDEVEPEPSADAPTAYHSPPPADEPAVPHVAVPRVPVSQSLPEIEAAAREKPAWSVTDWDGEEEPVALTPWDPRLKYGLSIAVGAVVLGMLITLCMPRTPSAPVTSNQAAETAIAAHTEPSVLTDELMHVRALLYAEQQERLRLAEELAALRQLHPAHDKSPPRPQPFNRAAQQAGSDSTLQPPPRVNLDPQINRPPPTQPHRTPQPRLLSPTVLYEPIPKREPAVRRDPIAAYPPN